VTDTLSGPAGQGQCPACGRWYPVRAGGTVAAHRTGLEGGCPGSGQQPMSPVPCGRCGRAGLGLRAGLCSTCRNG
jgi:hypothetical protein